MSCVISRWSPDLVSIVLVFKSMPFHFGWRVLPCCPWGEEVPWLCVDEAAAHGAKRPHPREVLFDALSLLPMEGEKNLKGMGEAAIYGAKSLHTREDNIMPVVDGWIPWPVYVVVWYLCDKLPYVRFYGFGNYIISAHRIWYIVSRCLLWETLCFIMREISTTPLFRRDWLSGRESWR